MFRRALMLAVILTLALSGVASAHWPVASRSSYVTQGYGQHLTRYGVHYAIDIAARYGTPVLAVTAGVVVATPWNYCGGRSIILRHSGTLYTLYAHLSSRAVVTGQTVLTGQRIGQVGRSGACQTGSHLHLATWRGFPFRSGSHPVNPWPYVSHGAWLPSRYR